MSFQRSVPVERALRSRAIDAPGHMQPATGEWNRLGYANNAIQVVRVTLADSMMWGL